VRFYAFGTGPLRQEEYPEKCSLDRFALVDTVSDEGGKLLFRRQRFRTKILISHPYHSGPSTGYYTPLAVVSRARKTPRVSTTATIAQIPAVSSKEGAVIGAVLSTRKSHRGHH
jgi:hypothetical protein